MLTHTSTKTRAIRFTAYFTPAIIAYAFLVISRPGGGVFAFFLFMLGVILLFTLYNTCIIGKVITYIFGYRLLYSRIHRHKKGDTIRPTPLSFSPHPRNCYFLGFSDSSHVIVSDKRDKDKGKLKEVHIADYFAFYKNKRINKKIEIEKNKQINKNKRLNQKRLYHNLEDEPLNNKLGKL